MEPAGNTPGMQSGARDWRQYFPSLRIKPHRGQRETFEVAAGNPHKDHSAHPPGDRLICLPTGYGKTMAGAGYYVIRREQGFVNRCLWIVSSDELRRGLAPEPDKETGERAATVGDRVREWFGAGCLDVVAVSGVARDYKMHAADLAEVYVTTYQYLREQAPYFAQLLDDCDGRWNWLVIADEAHHLAKEWALWLATRVPRAETLYMTATPLRSDKLPLRGVPSKPSDTGKPGESTYDACVSIPWKAAIDEQVIRRPIMHAQDWRLEFEDDNGNRVSLTTSELRDLSKKEKFKSGEDFDAWTVKQNFRYVGQYVQRIFLEALDTLNGKRSQWPGPHQMIIFAMSCGHAKFITHLLNDSFQKSMGIEADWIGVLRSDAENRRAIDKFKRGELPVLVQVDKVGEGFDCPAASVAVFLNLIQSRTKLLQQLGRVLRRLFHITFTYDTADVYADKAHEICEVIRDLQPTEDDGYHEPKGGDGGGDGPGLQPLPDWYDIEAELLDTDVYGPNGSAGYAPHILRAAESVGLSPEEVQRVLNAVNGEQAAGQQQRAGTSEIEKLARYQGRVDKATSRIVSHALNLTARNGGTSDAKRLAGLFKKNLNTRWKRANIGHEEMLSGDFKRKYQWLQAVDNEMLDTGKVPSWLGQPW